MSSNTKAAVKIQAEYHQVSGSKSEDFTNNLVLQVTNTIWSDYLSDEVRDQTVKAIGASLRAISPKDEIEGMLAAQMVVTHNATMECFRRAMIKGTLMESRDINLKHATKLTKAYTSQLEALAKYRNKGQQKMVVEHVTVNKGGQAIVGNVAK